MNDGDRPRDSFRPDEIAVDLQHRNTVITHLERMAGVGCATAGETDERLGLGLVTMTDVARTAEAIKLYWYGAVPIAYRSTPPTDIDIVLDGIKLSIGKEHGGWTPDVGKVRNADVVGGLPHIGSGWEYPASIEAEKVTFQLGSAGYSTDGRGLIHMLDSALYDHPDLVGRWDLAPGYTSIPKADEYPWLNGHAVFVLGKILERAPESRPVVHSVLDGDLPRATVWEVAKAMANAMEAGAKVLNLSLGCYTDDGEPPFVLRRAVELAVKQEVVVVAAAGNHGRGDGRVRANAPIFPAACRGVTAVGANDAATPSFELADLTPRAPWISLVAPGLGVESTYFHGNVAITGLDWLPAPSATPVAFHGYARWSGTSFAAATVSGEIARLMAERGMSASDAVKEIEGWNPADHEGIGGYR